MPTGYEALSSMGVTNVLKEINNVEKNKKKLEKHQ